MIVNFLGSLGGRKLSIADAQTMFAVTQEGGKNDSLDRFVTWSGLRGILSYRRGQWESNLTTSYPTVKIAGRTRLQRYRSAR